MKYIFSVQFLSVPPNMLYIELSYGVGFGYSFYNDFPYEIAVLIFTKERVKYENI